jgi:ferritin-like metal-binding protein YciE
MRKQMIENAAYEVATQVRTVEDSIEAALAEIAQLQARMVEARSVTRAGFAASHAAFEQLSIATASLITAPRAIGKCHVALVETQTTIPGLRTVAIGDEGECPPSVATTPLRIVA